MSQEASSDAPATEADRLLSDSLAGGEIQPAVAVALGTRAWKRGDLDAALAHLEKAYAADPSNVVAANNVAWLLSRRTGPNLDRALAIASDLVSKYPNAAQFRDTRGQILAKLGRWDEALTELERALPGMRDSVEIRRALAEAYHHLGQERLAELQDREADRLEAASRKDVEGGAELSAP
jgi:tetratricopeptide (TPR) repeat protein